MRMYGDIDKERLRILRSGTIELYDAQGIILCTIPLHNYKGAGDIVNSGRIYTVFMCFGDSALLCLSNEVFSPSIRTLLESYPGMQFNADCTPTTPESYL